MILIPEISSLREIRRSHQPVSSDFLIEINGCVLLQGNSENFLTENVIQDAFRLALSHVEVVIQCLLSKLLRKLSISVVFEALNDVVHCELCNILCSELRFHNGLRLSMQTSPIQPWSQSTLNSTCQSLTSVSHSANFSSRRS